MVSHSVNKIIRLASLVGTDSKNAEQNLLDAIIEEVLELAESCRRGESNTLLVAELRAAAKAKWGRE